MALGLPGRQWGVTQNVRRWRNNSQPQVNVACVFPFHSWKSRSFEREGRDGSTIWPAQDTAHCFERRRAHHWLRWMTVELFMKTNLRLPVSTKSQFLRVQEKRRVWTSWRNRFSRQEEPEFQGVNAKEIAHVSRKPYSFNKKKCTGKHIHRKPHKWGGGGTQKTLGEGIMNTPSSHSNKTRETPESPEKKPKRYYWAAKDTRKITKATTDDEPMMDEWRNGAPSTGAASWPRAEQSIRPPLRIRSVPNISDILFLLHVFHFLLARCR